MRPPARGFAAPPPFARRWLALAFALSVSLAASPGAARGASAERRAVQVLIPDATNLDLAAFWVALGAGYFAENGLDVAPIAPAAPAKIADVFRRDEVPAAILSGPEYAGLLADGAPIALAASLFQNDPGALVMRREVVERMALNTAMPLGQRLRLTADQRVGVPLDARARLYRLYFSVGLDANLARIVVKKPEEVLGAFRAGELDAIYVQSPFLERAVLDDDGIVLVDAPGGEVPSFAGRLVEVLAVGRAFLQRDPASARGLVAALRKAEHLLRADRGAAVAAIVSVLPHEDARRVARALDLYRRAIPEGPAVRPEQIRRELAFLPPGEVSGVRLAAIDLERYILPTAGGDGGSTSPTRRPSPALLACALALLVGLIVVVLDQRRTA